METFRPPLTEDETLDSFYHGRVLVIQKKRGYRFSLDAPLLADFIRTRPADNLLEIGAGCGIISLLLSQKPFCRLVCLEVQPTLAELAERNIQLNHLEGRIKVIAQDLRRFRSRQKFDVIFSNPPYIKKKSGPLSPSPEKAIAKHEIKCDIFDIIQLTSRLLKRNGRAYFIYPAARMDDFHRALEREKMRIKILRWVFPKSHRPARWFLAECSFLAPASTVLPPLVIYDDEGQYTEEMERIFAGEKGESILP